MELVGGQRARVKPRLGFRPWVAAAMAAVLAACVASPGAAGVPLVTLTDEEIERIAAHGPWPPPFRPDPGNEWSGDTRAITLGQRLFEDVRLSTDSAMSCATCHQPERAFTDGLKRGIGWRVLDRNTPSVLDIAFTQGADRLAGGGLLAQSVRPLLSPAEMNTTPGHLRRLFSGDADYLVAFTELVETPVGEMVDREVLATAGGMLAAYQETLVTPRTAFDDFRDALVAMDHRSASAYPVSAQRGLKLFVGRAQCGQCHSGPAFTHGGKASGSGPAFMAGIAPRVPGLRAVSLTAPYLRDGRAATLEELVRVHAPVRLDAIDVAHVVAFLESL